MSVYNRMAALRATIFVLIEGIRELKSKEVRLKGHIGVIWALNTKLYPLLHVEMLIVYPVTFTV